MSWPEDDVKRFKEKHGRGRQLERYFYPLLVEWVRQQHPSSRAYIGYKMGSPQVDVVEVNLEGEIIGFEMKLPHIGRERSAKSIQVTYIVQGVGQALEYLIRCFDHASLVMLQLASTITRVGKIESL
jgi:hypothetical protein